MSIIRHAQKEQETRELWHCVWGKSNSRKQFTHHGIYYEQHHILPKALFPKWENFKKYPKNRVLLTPREHWICHQLLDKIYPNSNMFYGLWWLLKDGQNNYIVKGSREFQRIKEKFSSFNSVVHSGKAYNKGKNYYNNGIINVMAYSCPEGFVKGSMKRFSEEEKKKISERTKLAMENLSDESVEKMRINGRNAKGRVLSEEARKRIGDTSRGSKRTDEQKKIISEASKLSWKNLSDEVKAKKIKAMNDALRGKKRTQESVERSASKRRGMKRTEEQKKKIAEKTREGMRKYFEKKKLEKQKIKNKEV